MQHNQTHHLIMGVLALAAVSLAAPAYADRNSNPGILTPDSSPYGQPYSAWAGAWWTWALTAPAAVNPVSNPAGSFASVNHSGPVWFLAGNFGGTVVREVTIPAGKALLFPVVNSMYGFLPFEEVDLEFARTYVEEQIDSASNLSCTIDGAPRQ